MVWRERRYLNDGTKQPFLCHFRMAAHHASRDGAKLKSRKSGFLPPLLKRTAESKVSNMATIVILLFIAEICHSPMSHDGKS